MTKKQKNWQATKTGLQPRPNQELQEAKQRETGRWERHLESYFEESCENGKIEEKRSFSGSGQLIEETYFWDE